MHINRQKILDLVIPNCRSLLSLKDNSLSAYCTCTYDVPYMLLQLCYNHIYMYIYIYIYIYNFFIYICLSMNIVYLFDMY